MFYFLGYFDYLGELNCISKLLYIYIKFKQKPFLNNFSVAVLRCRYYYGVITVNCCLELKLAIKIISTNIHILRFKIYREYCHTNDGANSLSSVTPLLFKKGQEANF